MIKDYTNIHQAYTLIEQSFIDEAKSYGALLKHNKTGAMVAVLSNEDNNKVFDIIFRTPPMDSTGVPHILEHSVLCGSKHFPVKDPFVELVKGSLNTFLNAMTFPDKTMYPVASCNDKDFQNLMHVYMDSVFYPNIYKYKEIFLQEGWHYEIDDDDKLTINGVVYNEMKGAFSSPDQVLTRKVMGTLFPDTTYGHESGGDPEFIPTLTYEQFLDFHRRYYHPSNSYIYLYGDMDVAEKLEFMDKAYLSQFDALDVDSAIALQKPFDQIKVEHDVYSIGSGEDEVDNTFLTYNVVLEDSMDANLYIAFQMLDYALMSSPGAPLKMALIESGIAKDVYGEYERSICQPFYSIVAKNSNVSDKDTFINIIKNTLNEIVKQGIDTDSLKACLNTLEFKFREGDYGWAPKGLMYGIQMMDSWLYDKNTPFTHLRCFETFDYLRSQIGTGYYEKLICKYLLDNTHASILVLEPKKGLATEIENRLNEKLAAYKCSLTENEVQAIVDEMKALEDYQETPSTQEALMSIPMLTLDDIKKTAMPLLNEQTDFCGYPGLVHGYETNGIGYVKLLFNMDGLSKDLIPYASLLCSVLGNVDTKEKDYQAFNNEINMHTGGIYTNIAIIHTQKDKDKDYIPEFEVYGKALYNNVPIMVRLMAEMMFDSKLGDKKRLKEIIDENVSRIQMMMQSSGHAVGISRALSYFSEAGAYKELISGIDYYRFLQNMAKNFESEADDIIEKMQTIAAFIFRKDNLLVDCTSMPEGVLMLSNSMDIFEERLSVVVPEKERFAYTPESKNEGFITSGMVQYDVIAGDFRAGGYEYHGGLNVLKSILGYEYLWTNIRVKGGAYGCMSGFGRDGRAYFASYRDPNLKETLNVYKNCGAYLKSFDVSDRDMLKYIIGAISDLDAPKNPNAEGARSLGAYLSGVTFDDLQKVRTELLATNVETIRGFGDLVESVVNQNQLCVVGSEPQIEKNRDLFGTVDNL